MIRFNLTIMHHHKKNSMRMNLHNLIYQCQRVISMQSRQSQVESRIINLASVMNQRLFSNMKRNPRGSRSSLYNVSALCLFCILLLLYCTSFFLLINLNVHLLILYFVLELELSEASNSSRDSQKEGMTNTNENTQTQISANALVDFERINTDKQ